MNRDMVTARPLDYRGDSIRGRFGDYAIPRPPENASERQVMDHAGVIAFCRIHEPTTSHIMGMAEEIERAAMAYLTTYHRDEIDDYYAPDKIMEEM